MITKMPVRLVSLSLLELERRRSFWDVGFCTGSVSIEAKLRYPHLLVTSFEVRPEGKELMEVNSRRFHAPGIDYHIGDFLSQDLESLPRPEAAFIGGYGGSSLSLLSASLRLWELMACSSSTRSQRRHWRSSARPLSELAGISPMRRCLRSMPTTLSLSSKLRGNRYQQSRCRHVVAMGS